MLHNTCAFNKPYVFKTTPLTKKCYENYDHIYSNNLDVLIHTTAYYCKLKQNISIKYRAFEG